MNADHRHPPADPGLATEAGIRALKVSLAGLLATSAVQAVVAVAGGSAGLLADTIHNLADAFTAMPLWIAFSLARRAANRRFTYGYGRAEDLAGVVVLLFVILSAIGAAYESYHKLAARDSPRLVELSLLAALVGLIGNEAVAGYKIRIGQRIGSAALVAEGRHSRADGLTSLAAGLGLIGARLGFPLADPLAGFFISLAIAGIAFEVGRDILGRLMDAIEPETVTDIERCAARVPGVHRVHDVRARWLGHQIAVELHICLDGSSPLVEAHRVGEQVRHELLEHVPRLSDVIVHLDPLEAYPGEHHRPLSPPSHLTPPAKTRTMPDMP